MFTIAFAVSVVHIVAAADADANADADADADVDADACRFCFIGLVVGVSSEMKRIWSEVKLWCNGLQI